MSFDRQPVLEGRLVLLRPLRSTDFDELFEVAAGPKIWQQHPVARHEEAAFGEFFREALASGGALVALDASTERVIGSSRFHDHDAQRREIEIGWTFLARSHWGGLYNAEMKRLMLRHAFQTVDRVLLLIDPENRRSQRAAEKIGALRVYPGTDPAGRWIYQITAPDRGPR